MLLVLPVLLWLGLWQLDRAEQKRTMFDQFGAGAPVASQQELTKQSPASLRYRQTRLRGRMLSERQFLLEGMTHEGRPGLQVLTPFELSSGEIVMVNRGWIPETRTRQTLPDLAIESDDRVIHGRITQYIKPGLRLAAGTDTVWPRRMVYPSHEDIAEALGVSVLPHMIWLDEQDADGFTREWKPAEFGPARHVGYAVQWFGLAVTLILIYIILKFRRRRGQNT